MFSLAQNYITRGFWGDEAWTSLISQLPYREMLKTTAADFHPPGYYTMIELWYKVFSTGEVSTRLVSIIFYLLTVFMVYKLASFVRGKIFGILSALVVAINPIFFTYAFEARNYTMFAFAATGSIFFLLELSKKFTLLRALGFIFFSTLGIYTHYYMFFVLAAEFIYISLFDRKTLFATIVAYFVVGLLYLPWLPFLLGQVRSVGQNYWIGGIDRHTHYEALLRILGGEQQNAIRPWLFTLSIVLLIIGLIQHALRHSSTNTSATSSVPNGSGPGFEKSPLRQVRLGFKGQAFLLIWLWAIVPFILSTLPGLRIDGVRLPFRPIFFWRYLIGASVPLSIVMVYTVQKLPKYLMFGSACLLLVLSLAIDFLTFGRQPYSFREVYQQNIVGQINASDKIVTVLPSFAEVLYYRNRNKLTNDIIVLPEGLVQFSGKSLLDAYVANGVVRIDQAPSGRYFELTPGPTSVIRD
ncbi:hypothetical protein A2696_02250 [Candidatus Curtissbacteria bacterium RIFCSPHIGHO2_01_FULL_41_13]|uniref:Glycosyltransferase RgtA/B/C/D-like domain-containing protein n=1 Tax=Candidatus Curtissbacteria bacterium RIFCSPHIGHO2_01_FULL_41_13 TaxID=1797745 RepID=A0A1F5FZM7_9BACT|nr:MAG: hypothetical protein A2696_02250 [Candidatus Curtissbacteria bacterium RIFCSPHIGHO2_01_FULL_41_13]